MSDKYILRGREAVPTDDLFEWARMFEDNEARRVAKDQVGDVDVSTVFLGLDHNWTGGPPLIFETMIFGGTESTWRYSTWEQAEAGHKAVVEALRRGLPWDGASELAPVAGATFWLAQLTPGHCPWWLWEDSRPGVQCLLRKDHAGEHVYRAPQPPIRGWS